MDNFIPIPYWNAPGSYARGFVADMLNYGQRIRDEYIWQYPLLPGAVFTSQQMVSGREFKVSGKPRGVARAIDYLNNAQTLVYDGTVDYGLEQFLRRRYLDNIAIGRNIFIWGDDGKTPLRYLDPYTCRYNTTTKRWEESYTNERFDVKHLVVNHPLPIGNSGSFLSPLSFVIPTAMLAWLVREHDKASADGRKIRDIMVVAGDSLAKTMDTAIKAALELWSGADPTSHDIPIVYVDLAVPGQKVADMITRIGLANIPEGFNREQFQFQYVNEIASALGLALRHFWNSEKATNRALEEVQEARANQKGPSAYIRSEQRLYNSCGMLEQFGDEIRFGFVEEVDIASQQTNAAILKLYAEALKIFVESLGGTIAPDQLVAWLQREDILPSDLAIIKTGEVVNPEIPPTPNKGKTVKNSDSLAGTTKGVDLDDILDYDQITMNGSGSIIDRRVKLFSFEKAIEHSLFTELRSKAVEVDMDNESSTSPVKVTWNAAVVKAREGLYSEFETYAKDHQTDVVKEILTKGKQDLGGEDFKKIRLIMDGITV